MRSISCFGLPCVLDCGDERRNERYILAFLQVNRKAQFICFFIPIASSVPDENKVLFIMLDVFPTTD